MAVECPICGESFPGSSIEAHAEACITASFGDGGNSRPTGDTDTKATTSGGVKRKLSDASFQESLKANDCADPTSGDTKSLGSKVARKQQAQAWSFMSNSGRSHNSVQDREEKSSYGTSHPSQANSSSAPRKENGQSSTISVQKSNNVPLAERMRPKTLDSYIGQESILGHNSFLKSLIGRDNFINMILWGPPGCGKTSLASVIAEKCRSSNGWRYSSLSACTSGVQDVKNVVKEAQGAMQLRKKRTLLFMDEIHRFNKAQQDIFLPHVESGLLTLVGATTENPSFSLNSALLSRCRVLTLDALSVNHVKQIVRRALKRLKIRIEDSDDDDRDTKNCVADDSDTEGEEESESDGDELEDDAPEEDTSESMKISRRAVRWLSEMSGGDARCALNTLQTLVESHPASAITVAHAKEALQRSHVLYDRKGDEHYHMASALQKSIRAGDDNAALYWTMRMVKGGEDPKYIARRFVRTAAEDIGLGDPQALTLAVSTMQAVQMLGMPESDVILGQCAVYLARAQHNPEVYLAMRNIYEHLENHKGQLPPVPLQLRNASTKLMKNLGYGAGYSYDPKVFMNLTYMPDALKGRNFFQE